MAMTADRPTIQLPAGWIRTVDRLTGRIISVAIPSKSRAGKYHLVNRRGCDCQGFAFHPKPKTCSHYRALLLALEVTPAPMLPACSVCSAPAHASQAEADAHHAMRAAQAQDIWGAD